MVLGTRAELKALIFPRVDEGRERLGALEVRLRVIALEIS